jgi:hypothetical protein
MISGIGERLLAGVSNVRTLLELIGGPISSAMRLLRSARIEPMRGNATFAIST